MPIEGELGRRGGCSGSFAPDVQGAIVRKAWCPRRASFQDLPPVVSLQDVLGASCPNDVIGRFHSEPDEIGDIDWFEVDRCPIRFVDHRSPEFDGDWLSEVGETVSTLNAGAPSSWITSKPSAAFRASVIMVKSELEHAAAFRSKNNEDW